MGLARVAAAVHYPSDVAGSAFPAVVPSVLAVLLTPPVLARVPVPLVRALGIHQRC